MGKKEVVDAMRILYEKSLVSSRDGNISFKPKNGNFFYITPSQVKKNNLTEDQLIRVTFDNVDCTLSWDTDGVLKPSREVFMHGYIHMHNMYSDVDSYVVHAHPQHIVGYCGLESHNELSNIKVIFPELNVGKIGKNVEFLSAGSKILASKCFHNLIGNNIIALEKHGSLSVGADIDTILEEIDTIEYYLKILLYSKIMRA